MTFLLGLLLAGSGVVVIWGGISARMAAILAAFFDPSLLGGVPGSGPPAASAPPASPQPGVPVPGVPGQTEGGRPTSSGSGTTELSPGGPQQKVPSTPPVIY